MGTENTVVNYLVTRYWRGDLKTASLATSLPSQQIRSWMSGQTTPRNSTLDYLLHCACVPEFQIVVEYHELDPNTPLRKLQSKLREILGRHAKASGIYGFYDSMGNLVYVGKSYGNLLFEIYQQLRAKPTANILPKPVRQPSRRLDHVRYLSAYFVVTSEVADHAKHFESLILRLSKPRLNKVSGSLLSTSIEDFSESAND